VISERSNSRDSVFIAIPPNLAHAMHGHRLLPMGHLVLSELHLPIPDLRLASSSEQNIHLIEAKLSVKKKCVFLLRPSTIFPLLFEDEAGCIRSR
jgi:hypothetical protein